ncbi:MAG: hypothetical protein PHR00_02685 [Patescibacteria group bacterium]|nr:hypothetical protein [Patescibacteria group bacterium]
MKINKEGELEWTPTDIAEAISLLFNSKRPRKIPKNKKEKIGIIIAIKTIDDFDRIKLENDVVLEINQYLKSSKSEEEFEVLYYPKELSERITDEKTAKAYLAKSRGHLIVYGLMEQGKIDGDNKYLFKLHGVVRHSPISTILSKIFSLEFRELLPSKIIFSENDEVLGFELTEKCLKHVIKYIVAIASFVSGDLKLSKALYFEIKNDIEGINNYENIDVLKIIISRIPKRITEVMSVYLGVYYNLYTSKRDNKYIASCKEYLDIIKETDPENLQACFLRSMYYFFEGNIQQAINEIKRLDGSDTVTKLNLGFLLAYSGDINGALYNYKKTFYKSTFSNIYNDTEIFISDVLEKEPKKTQLYFFRGFINFKLKNDVKLAKEDFLFFLQKKKKGEFVKLEKLAQKYLSIIDRKNN